MIFLWYSTSFQYFKKTSDQILKIKYFNCWIQIGKKMPHFYPLYFIWFFFVVHFLQKTSYKCPICVQDEFFQKVIHTNLMYLMYFNCNNPQNFTKNSSKWILIARVAEILTKIEVKMTNCTQCKSVSVTGRNQYYILMYVIYSNNLKNFKII